MTDERTGIELLRGVVGEVAASLPPPRRARRPSLRPIAWVLAGAAALVAILALGRFLPWQEASQHPRGPVEVLALRLAGRDAQVKVIDSPAVGSVVVIAVPGVKPEPRSQEGIR